MSVLLDITNEFEELKSSFKCDSCKNIPQQPKILGTCKHTVCSGCLDKKSLNCPVCHNPYFERDIEDDVFSTCVILSLNNIEQIINSRYIATPSSEEDKNDFKEFKIVTAKTVMKRNPKGETPLHLACKKGNVEKVEELLQKSVDVNMTDYANWTPLHEAVQSGSYDCCYLLLKTGALPGVPGEFYMTPLHQAISLDDVRIAELLIKYGASKDSIDYFGKKPTELSVSKEMMSILENTSNVNDIKPSVYLPPSPTIFYQGVSKEYKETLTGLKAKFVTLQDFTKRDDVSHLVLEETDTVDLKVLIAIVKGVFVVENQWIPSYSGAEDQVAFAYVPQIYKDTVMKSVCNRWMQRPKLFNGISFHIVDHEKALKIYGVNMNKRDLITLIEQGGGKHVVRPPALRTVEGNCYFPYHVDRKSELTMCCSYIIYNDAKPPDLLYNMKELQHKTSKWLIDCVLNFSIIDS